MKLETAQLAVPTRGRGTYDITHAVEAEVAHSGIRDGQLTLFIRHTSASLIVCENADPRVRSDLERFMVELVPDGDPRYEHDEEGPDDMPAHVRATLTATSLSVPIRGGRCALGTWQGIYLYEHRHHAHQRGVDLTLIGNA